MKTNFQYNEAEKPEAIRIEQVFAEKPAGGMIKNPTWDAKASTAVYANADGSFSLIKGYRVTADVAASATSVKVDSGSGAAKDDVIGFGKKSVTISNVTKGDGVDTLTLSAALGAIKKGAVLYEAKAASTDAAEPKGKPVFVLGNDIEGGKGDVMVRLINGANLRKETAYIGADIAALIPTINLV